MAVQATTVRDVMTTGVVTVSKSTGYKSIVTVMRRHRVSAVPVVDSARRVVGVLSEADLLRKLTDPTFPTGTTRLAWRLRERSKATGMIAEELMTAPAVTISPGAAVADAARLMQDRQVKRLPVVDEHGRLIGIVSRADVLSVFERTDSTIREEVTEDIIAGQFQLDPHSLDATVTSGIVTVAGKVDDRATALKMLGAIRHVKGVVGVRDRLTYAREELPDTGTVN